MSRAFCAVRMSRPMMPPLAWLTLAIGSPVMKCLTSSTSSDSYGLPQRRTGIFSVDTGVSGRRREGCLNRYYQEPSFFSSRLLAHSASAGESGGSVGC